MKRVQITVFGFLPNQSETIVTTSLSRLSEWLRYFRNRKRSIVIHYLN